MIKRFASAMCSISKNISASIISLFILVYIDHTSDLLYSIFTIHATYTLCIKKHYNMIHTNELTEFILSHFFPLV